MGRKKQPNRAIVDFLFSGYDEIGHPNAGITNDFLPIEITDDNKTINPKKRIMHLISDNMDLNYFWKKAVKYNPAYSICGRYEDLSIDEINETSKNNLHLRSDLVNEFMDFLKPTHVTGNIYTVIERNMLEIGPGYGGMKDYFQEELPHIKWHGMDINCLFKHPRLYRTDGYNIPEKLKDKNISLVYSVNVFQHLSSKQRTSYYKQIYKMLPENGLFLFGMFVTNDNLEQKMGEGKWLFGQRDKNNNPYGVFFSQLTEIDTIDEASNELVEIGYTICGREMLAPNYGIFLISK